MGKVPKREGNQNPGFCVPLESGVRGGGPEAHSDARKARPPAARTRRARQPPAGPGQRLAPDNRPGEAARLPALPAEQGGRSWEQGGRS
ncbi:hypothetical protein GCM10010452_59880 [Crossiella cryophila]